jgi:hypothetical protein
MLNWIGRGSVRDLVWDIISAFSWREWGEFRRTSISRGLQKKIWPWGLSNTKQECYLFYHGVRFHNLYSSANTFRVIKSIRTRLGINVTFMKEITQKNISAGFKRWDYLGDRDWEKFIEMGFRKIGRENGERIKRSREMIHWRAFVEWQWTSGFLKNKTYLDKLLLVQCPPYISINFNETFS